MHIILYIHKYIYIYIYVVDDGKRFTIYTFYLRGVVRKLVVYK